MGSAFRAAVLTGAMLAGLPVARGGELVFEGTGSGPGLTVSGMANPGGVAARCSTDNPIIEGENVYAPDLVRNGSVWNLYYGGWKSAADHNDRIYLAVSDDPLPEGGWSGQNVIVDRGVYLHVNDPSVVKRGPSDWVMAYTVARFVDEGYRDWIAISTSRDGADWSPAAGTAATEIELTGAAFTDIARPAIAWTGSTWKLWFDGRIAHGPLHSYLAESTDDEPRRFAVVHAYDDADGFPGLFEPDVERLADGRYVAIVQRGFSTLHRFDSDDGIAFAPASATPLLSVGDPAFGRAAVSNPGLLVDPELGVVGAAFGMTDSPTLVGHDIGFAYTQLRLRVLSCPDVWHVFAAASWFDRAHALTFDHRSYCRIEVSDPATERVLAAADVAAQAGDRWRYVATDDLPADMPGSVVEPPTGGCSASRDRSTSPLAAALIGALTVFATRRRSGRSSLRSPTPPRPARSA